MRVSAILVAAGYGVRLKSRVPKPLIEIRGLPLIIYSLKALGRLRSVKEIIIAVNPLSRKGISAAIKRYRIAKVKSLVRGGRARSDSVRNCLRYVSNEADLVLVHDAARPFIGQKLLTRAVAAAGKNGAAILGVPARSTIKEVTTPQRHNATSEKIVKRTLDRSGLWEIQTPQVFRRGLILKAYEKYRKGPATDDAALVERSGKKVSVVMGSYENIKITTPEDLIIAQAIAKKFSL